MTAASFSFIILAALLITASHATPLTWSLVSTDGPTGRGSAFAYDPLSNSFILYGGLSNSSSTWRYDITGDTWTESAAVSPANRLYAYFGVVRVNGSSIFVVTHGFGSVEYGDVWVYDIARDNWYQPNITGQAPPIRYGGHFGAFGNALWVGAGFTKVTTPWSRYIDTYRLVFSLPNEAHWETVHSQPSPGNQFNPLAPHSRCLQGSSVVDQDTLVMWGGCLRGGNGGGPCPAEDGWVFDNTNKKWSELPRCATPRVWSAMAPLSNDSGKAVLYGGSDTYTDQIITDIAWPENEVLIVDTESKTWTRYLVETSSGEYPTRRFAHAMAAVPNGAVYMYGGRSLDNPSNRLNDLWLLQGDPSQTRTVSCDRVWFAYTHLHGFFMIIAFGILFPTGALIARYYRCKGSKVWFIVHVVIQLTAVLFTIPAFIMIFPTGASKEPTHPHAIIGILLMTFMFIQPINGIFRPHIKEGKEKSKYRICWEWFHRIWGTFIVLLGLVQVTLGVFLIVPPLGVWVVWVLILVGWVIAFIVHETIKWVCSCAKPNDSGNAKKEKGDMEMKAKHP